MAVAKITFISLAALTAFAAPAFAQDTPGPTDERINQLVIYGDDKCPQSSDTEIVVCARMNESERYRIPEILRGDPDNPKNKAWLDRVQAYEYVGASGAMSCSTSGSSGFTGCNQKFIKDAYQEKGEAPGILFGKLIAEERKKRLAGIDAEAAQIEEMEKQSDKDRAAREAKLAEDKANGVVPAEPDDAADAEPLPEPK